MKILPSLVPDSVVDWHEYYILSRRGMLGSWRVVMSSPNKFSASLMMTRLRMMNDSRDLGIQYSINERVNCEFR